MDGFLYFLGIVIGLVFGGFFGFLMGTEFPPSSYDFAVVCEYEGGIVADDLCIKNDRVITIDMEN